MPGHLQTADVILPGSGDGSISLTDTVSGLSVSVHLEGALPSTLESAAGYLLYRSVTADGAHVIHRVTRDGTEDYVHFPTAPVAEVLRYRVTLGPGVAGLRLVGNMVEFQDSGGAPRLRIAPPWIVGLDEQVHFAQLSVSDCQVNQNGAPPWGRPTVNPGASSCTVVVDWSDAHLTYPALLDPSWGTAYSLGTARAFHTATLFTDPGNSDHATLLIAGGDGAGSAVLSSCEYFDTASSPPTDSSAPSLNVERGQHAAVLFNDGTSTGILVAGGTTYSIHSPDTTVVSSSVEFLPIDGTVWKKNSSYPAMNTARTNLTLTALSSQSVLAIGGLDGSSTQLDTAEKFTQGGASWTNTPTMHYVRYEHTATSLSAGTVLAAGGDQDTERHAEIYSNSTNIWTATADMPYGHALGAADILQDGRVIVAGGDGSNNDGTHVDLYSTVGDGFCGGKWTNTGSMATSRRGHALTAINGGALVTGGWNGSPATYLNSTEFYDIRAGTWSAGSSTNDSHAYHTSAAISANGGVVIVGGNNGAGLRSDDIEILTRDASGTTCSINPTCNTGNCFNSVCCDKVCACGGNCSTGTCTGTPSPFGTTATACGAYACNGTQNDCPSTCGEFSPCAPGYGCGLCSGLSNTCTVCPTTPTSVSLSGIATNQRSPSSGAWDDPGDYSYGNYAYHNMATGNFFGHIYPDVVEMEYGGYGYSSDFTGDHTGITIYEGTASSGVDGYSNCASSIPNWAPTQSGSQPKLEDSIQYYALATADLDEDGITDILIAQHNNSTGNDNVYVILKKATGACFGTTATFAKFNTNNGSPGDTPYDFAIADLDGDGHLDFVVANNGANNVTIFENAQGGNGVGTFTQGSHIPSAGVDTGGKPLRVGIADFDGDGKPDIVIGTNGGTGTHAINILQNTGSFSFSSTVQHITTTSAFPRISGMAVGDLNNDGIPDVAYTDAYDNKIHILTNTNTSKTAGTFSFSESTLGPPTEPSNCTSGRLLEVRATDLNNDGLPDLAVMAGCSGNPTNNTGELLLYLNSSSTPGSFSLNTTISSGLDDPDQGMVVANNWAQSCKTEADILVSHTYLDSTHTFKRSIADFHNSN